MEGMDISHVLVYALAAAVAVLAIAVIALALRVRKSEKLIRTFYDGTKTKDFETTLLKHIEHTRSIEKNLQELADFSDKVYTLAAKGTHKVGLVRFNPFGDVGGNQSFALALLDREKTGIVLSSLYGRDGTRLYAKPVQGGESLEGYGFSDEEKEAVEKASAKKLAGFST